MPAPTHLPAMGWLRDISIPRILLACSESRFQGHLSLERGSHRVKLHIEAGALFLVECDTDDHDLLAELVRAGGLYARLAKAQDLDHPAPDQDGEIKA